MHWKTTAFLAAAMLGSASPALAQVYGSMGNFDVVNDTGHDCQGFEVEIEDPAYDHTKIYSVFGLDRNFGVPPTSVERYGAPTITDVPGFGVRVRYQARFVNGAWSARTPSGPYANPGDSCWPLGNALYASGTLTCDHFGVATYGNPARVNYRWLCDQEPGGNSGNLTPVIAGVPPVQIYYQPAPPPPPGEPRLPEPVQVEVDAPEIEVEPDDIYGQAYWVKLYSRHIDHDVEIEQLMVDDPEVPGEDEVEIEWELIQDGDVNNAQIGDLVRDPDDAAIVLRYEFYKYQGPVKPDGEADCSGRNGQHTPDDCGGLGDYAGAHLAAFDAVVEPVPEPTVVAQLAAGLIGVALIARRHAPRA